MMCRYPSMAHLFAVPGTGRRTRRYRFLRTPRHASAKRGLLAVAGTLRGVSTPPTSWDDITRSIERTWKRHRLTRWRA